MPRKSPRAHNRTAQTSYPEKRSKLREKFVVEIESRLALDTLRKVTAKYAVWYVFHGTVLADR